MKPDPRAELRGSRIMSSFGVTWSARAIRIQAGEAELAPRDL